METVFQYNKPHVKKAHQCVSLSWKFTHTTFSDGVAEPPNRTELPSARLLNILITDDTVYFIGGSIKDLGKKIVAFSQMR